MPIVVDWTPQKAVGQLAGRVGKHATKMDLNQDRRQEEMLELEKQSQSLRERDHALREQIAKANKEYRDRALQEQIRQFELGHELRSQTAEWTQGFQEGVQDWREKYQAGNARRAWASLGLNALQTVGNLGIKLAELQQRQSIRNEEIETLMYAAEQDLQEAMAWESQLPMLPSANQGDTDAAAAESGQPEARSASGRFEPELQAIEDAPTPMAKINAMARYSAAVRDARAGMMLHQNNLQSIQMMANQVQADVPGIPPHEIQLIVDSYSDRMPFATQNRTAEQVASGMKTEATDALNRLRERYLGQIPIDRPDPDNPGQNQTLPATFAPGRFNQTEGLPLNTFVAGPRNPAYRELQRLAMDDADAAGLSALSGDGESIVEYTNFVNSRIDNLARQLGWDSVIAEEDLDEYRKYYQQVQAQGRAGLNQAGVNAYDTDRVAGEAQNAEAPDSRLKYYLDNPDEAAKLEPYVRQIVASEQDRLRRDEDRNLSEREVFATLDPEGLFEAAERLMKESEAAREEAARRRRSRPAGNVPIGMGAVIPRT